MNKEYLIVSAASKVHEDWCMQEYKAFYNRANKVYQQTGSLKKALELGCYKGEQKRNEIVFNTKIMLDYPVLSACCLCDFVTFMKLIRIGGLEIKRFTKRNLTADEQRRSNATGDYKVQTGEENILRKFRNLSLESKKENLEAAVGAYNVFEQFSQAGVTLEQLQSNDELRQMIGQAIHTDWLKRNVDHSNNSFKVSYDDLDDWTKQQDLTVFDALLKVIIDNKIVISPVNGYKLPDYKLEEQQVLEQIKRNSL